MAIQRLLSIAVIFSLLIGFSVTASMAQIYVSGNVGAVAVSDADISDEFFGGTIGEVSFDTGFGLTAGIGHEYGNGFRSEVELGYRVNDLDKITGKGIFAGFGSEPLNGDISSLSLMVNGYFDIDLGTPLTPFVMGGIGFSRISIDSTFAEIDDSDTVFAYQLGAGVSYALNPSLKLDLQYRFFGTSDPEFTDNFGDRIDTEYTTHNFMAGLRYSF